MKIFPVVHINEVGAAVREAEKALDMGADGVYLIDHKNDSNLGKMIAPTFNEIIRLQAESSEKPYVGVNILGLSAVNALASVRRARTARLIDDFPSALWIDDILQGRNPLESKKVMPQLEGIRILGGVAFKYTPTATDDPARAADEVKRLEGRLDVVTTSGSATAVSPSVEKIKAMKAATNKPIAIASGVSAENIESYAGIVDEVLVASSIETAQYSGVFIDEKLRDIIARAHAIN